MLLYRRAFKKILLGTRGMRGRKKKKLSYSLESQSIFTIFFRNTQKISYCCSLQMGFILSHFLFYTCAFSIHSLISHKFYNSSCPTLKQLYRGLVPILLSFFYASHYLHNFDKCNATLLYSQSSVHFPN